MGSAEACMDRSPDDDRNFFFMHDAFAEALCTRLKRAHAEDKKLLSKGPPDSDNLDRSPKCVRFEGIGGPRKV